MRNIIVLCLLLCGCIDSFVLDENAASTSQLAITGSITTLPGPQEIRVFQSVDISNPDITSFPVRDATVYTIDDLGNREMFSLSNDELQSSFCTNLERDLGGGSTLDLKTNYRYQSRSDFVGIPGRTYTLYVELNDGRIVASDPQFLEPAVEILETSYQYQPKTVINSSGNESFQDYWAINVRLADLEADQHLTWRYRGTHYISTNPELYCDYFDCSSPNVCIPQCCSECWITEYGRSIVNYNGGLNNEGTNQIVAATIPIAAQRTTSVYLVDLYQFHIDEKVYAYFESIDNQLSNQGSIFDPPPYSVSSNLYFEDDEEEVIGFFWAGGASHQTVEISPGSVNRQYDFFYPNDCQTIPGASSIKPARYTF